MVYYLYGNKFNQGSKIYYNLRGCWGNMEETTVERDALKKAILNKQVDVLNLQISSDGRLVDRNAIDSDLGKWWDNRIQKLISDIKEYYYQSYSSRITIKVEPIKYVVPFNSGFLFGYNLTVSYEDRSVSVDIYASANDKCFNILSIPDGNIEIISADYEYVVLYQLKHDINYYLGINHEPTNLIMEFRELVFDEKKGIVYPKSFTIRASDNLLSTVRYELYDYFKKDNSGWDNHFKMSYKKGSLPLLLDYCRKYGNVKPSVGGGGWDPKLIELYDAELTKYWNKKSSLISSDGCLYVKKSKYKMPKELYNYLMWEVLFRYHLAKKEYLNLDEIADVLETCEYEGETVSTFYAFENENLTSDYKYILDCINSKDFKSIAKLMLPILKESTFEIPMGTKLFVGIDYCTSSLFGYDSNDFECGSANPICGSFNGPYYLLASKGKAVVNKLKESFGDDAYMGIVEVITTRPMHGIKYGDDSVIVLECDTISFNQCKQTDDMYYFKGSVIK